jgi:hypothetical protein
MSTIALTLTAQIGDPQDPAQGVLLRRLMGLPALDAPTARAVAEGIAGGATPAFGELWPGQGGYYAGILPAIGDRPAQYMIASAASAEALKWGPYSEVEGAGSRHDGRANTAALMKAGSKEFPAAWWCSDMGVGPMEDFHLPSQAELFLASLYAPKLFETTSWYWSSTQNSRYLAFVQDFEIGYSNWSGKDDEHRVRAFRWIPLTT